MAETQINWDQLNQNVEKFAPDSALHFIYALHFAGIGKTGKLASKFKSKVGYQFDIASKIAYKFERYGVFVEKGVGRGYPIESVKGNAAAIASASGKGRIAKPWFNPTIEKEAARLADLLQQDVADIAVKNLFIK
jgi:hypothetical protein